MKDKNYVIRFMAISNYVTRIVALLCLGAFLVLLFVEGGHQEVLHFKIYDVFLLLSIPIMYSLGAFLRFKNEFINGTIIFISYVVYNILITISTGNISTPFANSYLLIPAIMFMLLYIIRRYDDIRKVEMEKLYDEYEQLNQNYKIIEVMHDITAEMLKDNDLDTILQSILDKAVSIIPQAQTGSILIKEKDRMVFKAAVGYDLNILKRVNLKFEDMYQFKLGNIYEPQVIRDIRTFNKSNLDEQQNKELDEGDALIAKSVLTCAIVFKDEIYGFINLDNVEDEQAFQEKDKIFIKHLAQQLEVVVRNQALVDDIYKLSRYDALTGAYTRTYHTSLLKEIYETSSKEHTVFSICNLDINELKSVNDHYGHDVGDAYIIYFSNMIKKNLSLDDMFSRMGGDEFIIVYKECDKKCAEQRIKELRSRFQKQPFPLNSKSIHLTFGCGISTFMEDSVDLEKLLVIADQRMYVNKKEMNNHR
ncbi:MAG: sensor domain-containing diguanylate cyclase [Acholeplasmataceae bacterium]|nr:sensor domain-containing diguanylate cyclase [Acholeplasmataceae bacterium]